MDGFVLLSHILLGGSKYAKNKFYGMTWRHF